MNDPNDFPVPEMIDALALDATSERLLTQEYYRQRWIAEFLDKVRKEGPDETLLLLCRLHANVELRPLTFVRLR